MSYIFNGVDKFFASLNEYIGLSETFVIAIALFLLVTIITFIVTSHSYEAKLVKAIDMLNGYFINNPKITEDNLVLFNQIMRHNKVPKLLRKHWQQFMLYREHNASYYMSFENCVVIPLRNSKFKRDKVIMNLFAYIIAGISLILNTYLTVETSDVAFALQRIFLAPVIILLLNYIFSIILDLKESAIISDLNQNYQYFETNMDKATKTLPDYVDYEILFDKQEIKKGIPVLYQYLQKRADDEQRELELARLKNVEHEKFDFDEAGLAGSLVLERAMQEAENYIAERKKYNQDIEQINSEMAQEDLAYREATKEYNRQMQVSKETFANFKQELEEATSTIQANYLKKQQQQELDRQRNLERDFDTATDRHKKVIESYQAELDSIDEFIANSRKSLQDAMMAEFATYSSKVYDEAKKVVEEREKEKYAKVKQEIKNLEEQLYLKNKQPDQYEEPEDDGSNKVEETLSFEPAEEVRDDFKLAEEPVEEKPEEPIESKVEENDFKWDFGSQEKLEEVKEEPKEEFNTMSLADFDKQSGDSGDNQGYQSYSDFLKSENAEPFSLNSEEENNEQKSQDDEDWLNNEFVNSTVQEDESTQEGENIENKSSSDEEDDDNFSWFDEILKESEEEDDSENKQNLADEDSNVEDEGDEENNEGEEPLEIKPEPVVKRKAGRPRKIVAEVEDKPKRKAGRPRKAETSVVEKPKGKRGRPKKVAEVKQEAPKRKAGRPRKNETAELNKPKGTRGRPKKVATSTTVEQSKKGPGRPKKKKAGRPRKVESATENKVVAKPKAGRGRPKKQVSSMPKVSKGRGRPKKVDLNSVDENVDLEAYLKVIDNAIAKENAKIKKTQKALEDNATLKTKKKK